MNDRIDDTLSGSGELDSPATPRDLFVRSVSVTQLHGMYDVQHVFEPGVNVIYGRNGAGKSTLLHILANALPGHYDRFIFLQFGRIEIELADQTVIGITRRNPDEGHRAVELEIRCGDRTTKVGEWVLQERFEGRHQIRFHEHRDKQGSKPEAKSISRHEAATKGVLPKFGVSYFPAFRAMLDAWALPEAREASRPLRRSRSATEFARELFGKFIPEISYSSLPDIERDVGKQISDTFRQVAAIEADEMTKMSLKVFESTVTGGLEEHRAETTLVAGIRKYCDQIGQVSELLGRRAASDNKFIDLSALKKVADAPSATTQDNQPRAVMGLYHNALAEVAGKQEAAVAPLRTFLDAVNRFLSDSRMQLVAYASGKAVVRHESGREVELRTLSSGGRQIVAMMFAATRLNETPVVLIDEPELSLHVDWQRDLLAEMATLTNNTKQIIVATHSPEVSAEVERRRVQKFRPNPTTTPLPPDPMLSMDREVSVLRPVEDQA